MTITDTQPAVWVVDLEIKQIEIDKLKKFVVVDANGNQAGVNGKVYFPSAIHAFQALEDEISAWNAKYQGKRAYRVKLPYGVTKNIGPAA